MNNSTNENTKEAYRVSLVSIAANTALSLFKLLAGVISHSTAMISDGIHSASDVLSTFIVMIGIHLSGKQSDKEHPYGHERMECVASIILAVMLAGTGLVIGYKGLKNIVASNTSVAVPGVLALVAAVISITVKEAMFWYTRYHARRINSGALMADAWHHRSDAMSSVGALIGIAGARMGYPRLDPLASIVICVFILKASYDIFKDAVDKMVDHSADDSTESQIRAIAEAADGVDWVDDLKTREFGNVIYAEMEISVNGSMSLSAAHDIARKVHDEIEKQMPSVKHILIHVNPSEETSKGIRET